jgi:hypothetical protein
VNIFSVIPMAMALALVAALLTAPSWGHRIPDRVLDVIARSFAPIQIAIVGAAAAYAIVLAIRGDGFNALACAALPAFILAVDPGSRNAFRDVFRRPHETPAQG